MRLIQSFFMLLLAGTIMCGKLSAEPNCAPADPGNIHLYYTMRVTRYALPSNYIDQQITKAKGQLQLYENQVNNANRVIAEKTIDYWKSRRNKRSVNMVGEYWGGPGKSMWRINDSLVSYNGAKMSVIDCAAVFKNMPRTFHRLEVYPANSRLDSFRPPYLGFFQAGREMTTRCDYHNTDGGKTIVTSTIEDKSIRYKNKPLVFKSILIYDAQDRLVSFEKNGGTIRWEKWTYSNFRKSPAGFAYPCRIQCDLKESYDGFVPDETEVYTIRQVDFRSHPDEFWDRNQPPVGTSVRDARYPTQSFPDGVLYDYNNPDYTVDQISETIASGKELGEIKPWAFFIFRFICYLLVLLIVGRAAINLFRKEIKSETER